MLFSVVRAFGGHLNTSDFRMRSVLIKRGIVNGDCPHPVMIDFPDKPNLKLNGTTVFFLGISLYQFLRP